MFKDLQSPTWHQTIRENSCYCKQDGESALEQKSSPYDEWLTGELVGFAVDLDDSQTFLL